MTSERIVRVVAGALVLAGLALGAPGSPLFASAKFLWLAVFVGANLLQSGISRFCPLELVLRRAGVPACAGRASPTAVATRHAS